MLDVLPPPLSRAHREEHSRQARAVKASLDELLAEVDDVLGPVIAAE